MSDIYKSFKYFITGGGTGGHIYPAVAIGYALRKQEDTKEVFYVGNPNNMEFGIAKDKGFKFLPVKVSAMPRKLSFSFVFWSIELGFAVLKALLYIKKYKPDVIIGTGGYVSAPALIGGIILKVPIMIHDCDAVPGIVSRCIAPYAKNVSVAFEKALEKINNKNIHVNGNPLREDFMYLTKEEARTKAGLDNKITLCVMGGSQGASSINRAFVSIVEKLSKEYNLQIIFQTGAKKFDDVIKLLKKVYPDYANDKNLIVKPFFNNMSEILKSTDIAISRAGSLSLSELCACSVASILVPYPHAAADHQRKNAKFMEQKRAALYLEDADVTKDTLLIAIEQLLDNKEKLNCIQNNIYSLAKPYATDNIISQIKEIVNAG